MASVTATATAVGLEERLRRHSAAFTQLLNLIPAKNYFSVGDGSTQWNKRKQTKEESQRAKKAKLDPDAFITTSDFGRQQQQQQQLEANDTIVLEVRGADEPMTKKQKKQQKKDAKAAEASSSTPKPAKGSKPKPATPAATKKEADAAPDPDDDGGEAEEIQLSGFTFSTDLTATPPPAPSTPASKKTAEISPEKRLEQKARLEARIQQLRARRNADSPDGTPARNRNELMAARRKEEAQTRKERKKEQRLKQRAVKSTARPGSSSGGVGGGGGGGVVVGTPRGTPVPTSAPASAVTTPAPKHAPMHASASVAAPGSSSAGKAAEKQKKKAGAKKSRPGFEGSIKAGKGGSSKKGRK
ncbi:60S ribosome biogenesis protein Rrp14-domain-containing protein [Morchella snyderi]|nr:60S ribosome biogenesis protein Rrp14-domain-containing protein [Morchella snyderi]